MLISFFMGFCCGDRVNTLSLKEEFTKRVENSSFHRFASKEQESYKNTGDFLTSDLTSDLTSEIGSDFGSDKTRYKKNRFHPPPVLKF